MLDLLEHAVKRAEKLGASQAEAFYFSEDRMRTTIQKKQVKTCERKFDAGASIRVAAKKKGGFSIGFSYFTDLSKEAAAKTAQQALKVASFKRPDGGFQSFQERKLASQVKKIHDKAVARIEPETIVDLASDLVKTASVDKKITTIGGGINLSVGEVALANSLGVSGHFNFSRYGAGSYVVAQDAGSVAVGWDEHSNCFFDEDEAYTVFKSAAKNALAQLHPKAVKTEKMDLLIQPQALAQLLGSTLIQAVRADNVQKSQSPFVGKLNQSVASSTLSMVDDGHIPQAFGSRPFDDEGCPTQATKIIDKGGLRGFLHNSYTSGKDKVKSTGNSLRSMGGFGTRPRYCVEPQIGSTNLRLSASVKSAEDSLDGVVSEVKNGVMAKGVIGAHTANSQSGEFSVALDLAYKVERGEVSFPIKQAMIGGNIQDLLRNVSLFADDVTHVGWEHTAIIVPTILVKNVTVSG